MSNNSTARGIAGLIRLLIGNTPRQASAESYRRQRSLLTPTEARFYAALVQAVAGRATICPKVRIADILDAADLTAFRRISQKHVDFLLCTPGTLIPWVAVELDDPSHLRPDRAERDRFVDAAYQSAGVAVLHYRTRSQYDPAHIDQCIGQAINATHTH